MENIRVKELEPLYDVPEHRDFRALLHYADQEYKDKDAFLIKVKPGGRGKDPVYRAAANGVMGTDFWND